VKADFKEASVAPDTVERRRLQTLTLASVFETYFRVLKTSLDPADQRWLFPLVVIYALGFPTMLFLFA
jgi:nucleolar complex protein 3